MAQPEDADLLGARHLRPALAGASGPRDDVRKAWATALALGWLRHCARHVEHEWWMLAAKVRKWLDGVEAVPPGEGAWVNEAAVACDWPLQSGDAQ